MQKGDMMVEVGPYDPAQHTGVSRDGRCAQGGQDTCSVVPEFSVIGERYRIAACARHLAGAVRAAAGMPARRPQRS